MAQRRRVYMGRLDQARDALQDAESALLVAEEGRDSALPMAQREPGIQRQLAWAMAYASVAQAHALIDIAQAIRDPTREGS